MPEAAERRPPPEVLPPETESALDASLDEALDKHGIESGDEDAPGEGATTREQPAARPTEAAPKPEKGTERARDERGKFAAPEKPEATAKPAEQPKPKEPDADLEKALGVLRRSKSFDEMLPAMSRDQIVKAAAIEQRRHAESDDLSRRLGQFSTPRETAESATESTHGREPSAEQPVRDNLRSVQPLLQSLGLEGDKDAERSLSGFAREIAAETAARFAPLQQELAHVRFEVANSVMESVRQELVRSGRYDEFKVTGEGTPWAAVDKKALSLFKSEDYGGNLRACIADAVLLVAGRGRELPDPAERDRQERARENGVPDLPTGSNREKTPSPDQRIERGIDAAFSRAGM